MAQPRSGARKPATKFAHLRKKLQKSRRNAPGKLASAKGSKRRAN